MAGGEYFSGPDNGEKKMEYVQQILRGHDYNLRTKKVHNLLNTTVYEIINKNKPPVKAGGIE